MCTTCSYIPRIMFRWQIKRNRGFVECRQFSLRPVYTMLCNKSQDNKSQCKAMNKVATDLTSAPFAHGRLHVPVGRVQKRGIFKLYVSLPQSGQEG